MKRTAALVIVVLAIAYFTYLIFFAGLTSEERRRAYVLIALFVGCAIFFAGYEQMGASFNLFAQRYTERHLLGRAEIECGSSRSNKVSIEPCGFLDHGGRNVDA